MSCRKAEMTRLLKFYHYMFGLENYLLLARVVQSAWLVRKLLPDQLPAPSFASALEAVDKVYLAPQRDWKISDEKKIARFAGFVVNFPIHWGKCVQQSLIIYRLLNGYGIPAKICFGVSRGQNSNDGHAWVIKLSEPERPFAEVFDPRERFKTVYISPIPEAD
ncbi:MAG: lasso peptide biosynthesis B2 protein [Blastocatellales bacterium]